MNQSKATLHPWCTSLTYEGNIVADKPFSITTTTTRGKDANQSKPSNSPDPFSAEVSCMDHWRFLISGRPNASDTCRARNRSRRKGDWNRTVHSSAQDSDWCLKYDDQQLLTCLEFNAPRESCLFANTNRMASRSSSSSSIAISSCFAIPTHTYIRWEMPSTDYETRHRIHT